MMMIMTSTRYSMAHAMTLKIGLVQTAMAYDLYDLLYDFMYLVYRLIPTFFHFNKRLLCLSL